MPHLFQGVNCCFPHACARRLCVCVHVFRLTLMNRSCNEKVLPAVYSRDLLKYDEHTRTYVHICIFGRCTHAFETRTYVCVQHPLTMAIPIFLFFTLKWVYRCRCVQFMRLQ